MRETSRTAAWRLAARALTDTSGNVALMFGLAGPVLLAMSGFAIDYGNALSVRTKLNDAADAAALAAVAQSSVSATPGSYLNTTALKGSARAVFDVNAKNAGAVVSDVTLDVSRTDNLVTAKVSYSASVPTYFGGLVGIAAIPVAGQAASSHGMPSYVDFHLALDISQSMGLAATTADMTKLASLTGGCAFACHTSSGSASDNYSIARSNGVLLRIDAVRDATSELIDDAQTKAGVPGQFRVALYGFNAGLTQYQALTSSMANAKTAANNIGMKLTTTAGLGETDYANIPKIAADIPAPGDGTSATSPKQWLFLVTDGVQDVYDAAQPTYTRAGVSAAAWGHDTQPLTSSMCDAIKARGVQIAVLYTTYLPIPTRSEWTTLVKPFNDQIPANLKACASPNFFFEARDADDIHTAMDSMFTQAVTSARLTQ